MAVERATVLVPVKAFSRAKERLSGALSPEQRAKLARSMAAHVLEAAAPLPTAVVCDDREVAEWATSRGAQVLSEPGRGLNGAVNAAAHALEQQGCTRLIVAHSDLPLAQSLGWLAQVHGIVLVPDRHGDGTNVISLPAGCGLRFSYGPGSFRRHLALAEATGFDVSIQRPPDLVWDIDVPDDLNVPDGSLAL